MAVIHDISTAANAKLISSAFWSWYYQHSDDVVFSKRFFWFTVTIRVSDTKPLFERLFGSVPASIL